MAELESEIDATALDEVEVEEGGLDELEEIAEADLSGVEVTDAAKKFFTDNPDQDISAYWAWSQAQKKSPSKVTWPGVRSWIKATKGEAKPGKPKAKVKKYTVGGQAFATRAEADAHAATLAPVGEVSHVRGDNNFDAGANQKTNSAVIKPVTDFTEDEKKKGGQR